MTMCSLNPVKTRKGAFESLWLLARRFMLRNCLRPRELRALFQRNREDRKHDRTPGNIYTQLDLEFLSPYLGHSPTSIDATLPGAWEVSRPEKYLGPLKFCPECAVIGYHSVFHEVQWLDTCPIHECSLTRRCLECNRLLLHVSHLRLGRAPNQLACGHTWTDADLRRPPKIDTSVLVNVARWIRRLHSPNTGEQWFAVALGGQNALVGHDRDFMELLELFAAIGGFSPSLRDSLCDSLRLRDYVAMRPVCWSPAALRADWFEAALQRAGRYVDVLNRTDYDISYMGHHRLELTRSFRKLGKRAFVQAVRNSVELVDLRRRRFTTRPLPPKIVELLSYGFLRKHLLATTVMQADPYDTDAYLRMAMRMTGQPLGFLRWCASGTYLYWAPLARDASGLLELLESNTRIRRYREEIRANESNSQPLSCGR